MAFQHQAFLYDSADEFVTTLAPFIRDGLERGDTVFAATNPANVDALREELGPDSSLFELHDTTEWCTQPYARLQAFKRLAGSVRSGTTLRAMGEPVWSGSDAVLRQWARYESIINLALAGAPMRFICLYDESRLPDAILEVAGNTHPERVDGGGGDVGSPEFVPPHEFNPGSAPEPPSDAVALPMDNHAFREAVGAYALEAGLQGDRADDFVLATHELAANALQHGSAPRRAHIWTSDGELVCQVTDSGAGIADPLAGWLPPSLSELGGWGLPIARQLCDAIEVGSGERGATVTAYASLTAPAELA